MRLQKASEKRSRKTPKKKRWNARGTKRRKYPYKGEEMASKAEVTFSKEMDSRGILWMYEPEKFKWFPPPVREKLYTPDYKVRRKDGSYFFVEFKGYLRPNDKVKMRAMKK